MSYKTREFQNGKFYHVFNKTVDSKTPFLEDSRCNIFLFTSYYYRASDLETSFSLWKRLNTREKNEIRVKLHDPQNYRVQIVAYCLMPNHFHFILKQIAANGIHDFISNSINSFTRAYNTEYKRKGPLFLHRFHHVPINSSEQLLTVSRYIHRNPIAHMTHVDESFRNYPWSSYKDYLELNSDPFKLTCSEPVMKYFSSAKRYQEFVEDDLI